MSDRRPSAEQEARDMLERMDIADAQQRTAGDVVELANLIAAERYLRAEVERLSEELDDASDLRNEVARLTRDNERQRGYFEIAFKAHMAERALADQLAEALVYQRDMIGSGMDKAMLRNVRLSLEAWEAARHE